MMERQLAVSTTGDAPKTKRSELRLFGIRLLAPFSPELEHLMGPWRGEAVREMGCGMGMSPEVLGEITFPPPLNVRR